MGIDQVLRCPMCEVWGDDKIKYYEDWVEEYNGGLRNYSWYSCEACGHEW